MVGDFALGGRLVVRITPSDVGKRVSVRRVVEDAGERPVLGDVVGVLTSWDGGVLTIARRTGQIVRVSEESLVAGKTVPRAPARTRGGSSASAAELQRIASRGWPAEETEPLGGWTLRAAGGFTRRANSVLPDGDPAVALDEALAGVTAWYAERGLPARVQVTTGAADADEALAAELDARGWSAEGGAIVLTGPLLALAGGPGPSPVRVSRRLDDGWLARYGGVRTWQAGHGPAAAAPHAAAVLEGGPSVWFARVPAPDGGVPLAIGRCVVDGRWAGFAAVEVAPEQRRRGLATAVMAALAERAAGEGADTAYLQVETDNAAALALYEGRGLVRHHAYHYRRAPGGRTVSPAG
jgi:N-acetylglutamate synthase